MRFIVSFRGKRRPVTLSFGHPMDMYGLLRWRIAASERDDPQIRDAMEFRKLATKRWRDYLKGHDAATSVPQLKRAIRANPRAKIGFLLVTKPRGIPPRRRSAAAFAGEAGATISSLISSPSIPRCSPEPAGRCAGSAPEFSTPSCGSRIC